MGRRDYILGLRLDTNTQDITNADQRLEDLERTFADLDSVLKGSRRQYDEVAESIERVGKAAGKSTGSLGTQSKTLSKGPMSSGERLGNISSGAGALAQVAGALNIKPLQEALNLLGDISGAMEQWPRLRDAVKGVEGASTTAAAAQGVLKTATAGTTVAATGAVPAVGAVGVALAPLALAAAALIPIVIALKIVMDQVASQKESLEAAYDAQDAYYRALYSGTEQSIKAQIAALEETRFSTENQIRDQQAVMAGWGEVGKFIGNLIWGLNDHLSELQKTYDATNGKIEALNRALNDENVKSRSASDETAALNATLNNLHASSSGANAAESERQKRIEETKRKLEEAKRAEEERQKKIKDAQDEIVRLQVQAAQQGAKLERERANRMIDIARKYAQDSQDALKNMQQDRAALERKLGDDQTQATIEAQRNEAQAARDHLRTLEEIRRDGTRREFDDVRNRDFAALAQSRRETSQAIEDEQEQFVAERQQRQQELQATLQDQARNFSIAQRERLLQYQNDLRDLRTAKIREQQEARIAARRQLEDLRVGLQQQIEMKRLALQQELGLYKQFASVMGRATVGGGYRSAPSIFTGTSGATSYTTSNNGQYTNNQNIYLPSGVNAKTVADIAAAQVKRAFRDLVG